MWFLCLNVSKVGHSHLKNNTDQEKVEWCPCELFHVIWMKESWKNCLSCSCKSSDKCLTKLRIIHFRYSICKLIFLIKKKFKVGLFIPLVSFMCYSVMNNLVRGTLVRYQPQYSIFNVINPSLSTFVFHLSPVTF